MTAVLHVFVDVPGGLVDDAIAFWSAVTGWAPGHSSADHPELCSLQPVDGAAYVHVQRIDGPAGVRVQPRGRANQAGGVLRETETPRLPAAATWPDGHRSRIRQVCLDLPMATYEQELAFWEEATGWRREPGRHAEYEWLRPETGQQQLLIQRLGEPVGPARAHLDVASDDVAKEVLRVERLGASRRPGDDAHDGPWVVLRDPADLPFCITDQQP